MQVAHSHCLHTMLELHCSSVALHPHCPVTLQYTSIIKPGALRHATQYWKSSRSPPLPPPVPRHECNGRHSPTQLLQLLLDPRNTPPTRQPPLCPPTTPTSRAACCCCCCLHPFHAAAIVAPRPLPRRGGYSSPLPRTTAPSCSCVVTSLNINSADRHCSFSSSSPFCGHNP